MDKKQTNQDKSAPARNDKGRVAGGKDDNSRSSSGDQGRASTQNKPYDSTKKTQVGTDKLDKEDSRKSDQVSQGSGYQRTDEDQ